MRCLQRRRTSYLRRLIACVCVFGPVNFLLYLFRITIGVQTAVKIEEEAIDVTIAVKQEKDSGLVVVGKRKENGNGSVMSVEAKKTTVKRKTTSHANLKLRHAAFKYLIRWIPDNTGMS